MVAIEYSLFINKKPHLISILPKFRRTQNIIPVFTINALHLF